jgi:alpha/beta superfamily hydrolase
MNESFDVSGPAGRLEAVLMHPEGTAVAGAVVCHADPLQGGMLHFKLVFRVAKALQAQGLATLRFNFRGVGRSEGVHDHGRGEQDDAVAALDELQRRFPGLPLVLGGFSFGAAVSLRIGARDGRVGALFALGLPLSKLPDVGFLAGIRRSCLFVQGEHDPFGSAERVREVAAGVPGASVVVVPGADHFFTDQLDELQGAVGSWASRRPWEAPPC